MTTAVSTHRGAPSLDAVEQRFVIRGVRWADYVAMREALDVPGLRMTFCEGTLELMSPSPEHERLKSVIARLLELFALEADVALYAYGSTTFRAEARARGLEPDECYFVGRDRDAERRPFPDIALEVVLSSGGMDKLAAYAGLEVREVWLWEHDALQLYALRSPARTYARIARSELLPSLDVELLARAVGERDQHAALKAYRAALASTVKRARGAGRKRR